MAIQNPEIWAGGLIAAGSGASATGRGLSARRQQRRQQAYSRENMNRSYQFSRQLMHESMDKSYAQRLEFDSNKYQRQMTDMLTAGLNPALIYSTGVSVAGGSGGGSPGVSAPGGASAGPGVGGPDIGAAVSTALEAKRVKKEMRIADKTIDNINAQIDKTEAETESITAKTGGIAGRVNANIQAAKRVWKNNPGVRKAYKSVDNFTMHITEKLNEAAGAAFNKYMKKFTGRSK